MKRETWLPAAPESAAAARAIVREAGRQVDLDGEALWDLTLATSEAVANAVEHGGACGDRGEILLRIERLDAGLCVEIRDCGSFRAPAGAPEERSVRGRGLPIIAAVTDRLELLPGSGETSVRFEKRIGAAA